MLAEDIMIAYAQTGLLPAILKVLRRFANRAPGKKAIMGSYRGAARDIDVRTQDTVRAQFDRVSITT